ncbi:MAG: hypothetical protein ACRENU_04795, partial [Gemmatimonadaceae bacterium]
QIMQRFVRDSAALASARADNGLTRSPAALKDWLAARQYLRRGLLDSADAAITRSIAQDSHFVMALSDAAVIRSWLQFSMGRQYSGLRELAERAVRLADTLPNRPQLRANALLASIETRGAAAARFANAILGIDNLDFDASNMLSYFHMAYGWQYGVGDREIVDAAERVYRLDTTDVGSISRRAYIAVAMNDANDIDAQVARLRRVDTTMGFAHGLLRGIEALRADDQGATRLVQQTTRAPIPQWISMYRTLRMFRPERAEQLSRATLADSSSANRAIGASTLAQLSAAQSRWAVVDSMRQARAYAQIPGFETQLERFAVAASIAGATDDARGARAAAALETGFPPDSALAWFNKRPSVWHDGWLIGAHNAMYGDTVLAKRWHATLGTLPAGGSPREYHRALQADIASRLAARRGDGERALAEARRAYELWNIHTENQLEHMPSPAIRFSLAQLLRDAGKADSAAALFKSLVPPTTFMGFYTARAALELADLELAAGARRDAERHYLLAARLLERSEPSVAALKERARRGLARISGD